MTIIVGVLLLGISVVGCTESRPAAGEPFVLSDSAGIEVALNRPGVGTVPTLQLEDPLLRLGSEVGGSPEFFGQINSLHLDPNGNLWVADIMSSELRVFAVPSGEHLFTVGRRGEGPGEFVMPMPIGFDEDGAWVWDRQLGRLTVFTLDGEFVEVQSVVTREQVVPQLLHRSRRGTFVGRLPQRFSGPLRDGLLIHDTVRVWEFDGFDVEPELLVKREGMTWIYGSGVQAPVPFTGDSRFEVRDDRLVATDPSGAPVLDVIEGGRLERRIKVERDREAVTRELIDEEVEGRRVSEQAAALLRARLPDLPVPEFIPTWEWIRLSPLTHVFALRHGTLLGGERWDVFDSDGRLVRVISLPDGAHLMEVGEQFLVVLEMPEMTGARIAVYPMEGR
jgi:hypothetical protein